MLGHDSTAHGNDVTTVRSSCAVLVDSQNQNREWLYAQQQTVSAEGFAGTAFSPFYSARHPRRPPDQDVHGLPPLAQTTTTTPGWRSS